jgi:hypothetical protein
VHECDHGTAIVEVTKTTYIKFKKACQTLLTCHQDLLSWLLGALKLTDHAVEKLAHPELDALAYVICAIEEPFVSLFSKE